MCSAGRPPVAFLPALALLAVRGAELEEPVGPVPDPLVRELAHDRVGARPLARRVRGLRGVLADEAVDREEDRMKVHVDRHEERLLLVEARDELLRERVVARLARLERVAAHRDGRRRDRPDGRARALDLRPLGAQQARERVEPRGRVVHGERGGPPRRRERRRHESARGRAG